MPDSKRKQKKRKFTTPDKDSNEGPSKASRLDKRAFQENEELDDVKDSETPLEFGPPWGNLQLILSLQNKELDIQRKVELAYAYVKLKVSEEENNVETVSVSRVVVFLSNWVQSLLMSSEKRIRVEGSKHDSSVTESCLDYRWWEIFKFCLEESKKVNVTLSFSRDFLRVIHCIARDVLARYSVSSSHIQAKNLDSEVFNFYDTVLGCVSSIFVSHGGISNENLDLWILAIDMLLKLVRKILEDKLDNSKIGTFVLQLLSVVINPFTRFLRVHPTKKNGFNDFVNKLLEPLLYTMNVLYLHTYTSDHGGWENLLKLIKEALCQGLFHQIHIDGFTSLQSLSKYMTSDYEKIRETKSVVKSYHRHLFDKLEKIVARTDALALGGVGELFHLYVDCIKKQKGISSVGGKGSGQLEDDRTGQIGKFSSRNGSIDIENSNYTSGLNPETRKLVFDFFVQMLEPFLKEIDTNLQDEMEIEAMLSTVHCTFQSINKLLVSFMQENVYVRTEDTSEGACVNFLKVVYDTIKSLSTKIKHIFPSMFREGKGIHKEVINQIVRELIVSIRCLLEIEYEVVGNDLESLWLLMISHGAFGVMLMDKHEQSLTLEIIKLGIQMISIYSELRQVDNSVFALCKAVRQLVLSVGDGGQMSHSNAWRPSLYSESCAKFVGSVLCSPEFRLSVYNAIKSIPEGQVSGFVRHLTADVSESLIWMQGNCEMDTRTETAEVDPHYCTSPCFKLKAELLGRGLSELYALTLDSITATTGNSTLVGVALKDLMAVIRPNMSSLVGLQPDSIYAFLSTITGRTITMGDENLHVYLSTHLVILFFFRLYMSSKSLYRQAVGLVPPDISKKMSASMGDVFTAYSGWDWLQGTSGTDEGYFSWIVQPSASLISTIKAVLHICLQDSVNDCSSLIYVLIAMAFQRLVDLNRLIKSFEYLLQMNDILTIAKHKKSRKWRRHVSDLTQEAAELTNFVMEYVPSVNRNQPPISLANDAIDSEHVQSLTDSNKWDFSIGAITTKSFPTAVWWIICQNIDVWCAHPAKKKLKKFVSILIQSSISTSNNSLNVSGKHITVKDDYLKIITTNQISCELLSNAILYEQSFVCRHMASRFCKILEKSVSAVFKDFKEIQLNVPPDWTEVLDSIESSLIVVSDHNNVVNNPYMVVEPSYSSNKFETKACQSLLELLCWMPKGYLSSRCLSEYSTCILNFERILLSSLIHFHGRSQSHECYELLRLFTLCRKALNKLTAASDGEKVESSHSLSPIYEESLFTTLWLLKSLSAVIGLQHIFPDDCASQSREMIFSLMDHTSYVILTFGKDQFMQSIKFLLNSMKPCEEKPDLCLASNINFTKDDRCLDSATDLEAWNTVVIIAESLSEQAQKSLMFLKEAPSSGEVKVCAAIEELKRFSPITSCIQGLLWGLASALDEIDGERFELKSKLPKRKFEPLFRINTCINYFAEFISYFINIFFLEEDKLLQSSNDAEDLSMVKGCDDFSSLKESSGDGLGDDADIYNEEQQISENAKDHSPSTINDKSHKRIRVRRKHEDVPSFLTKIDLFDQQSLKKSLLLRFLRGENPEAAFFLRQLFISYSAILRINLHIKNIYFSARLVPTLVAISEVLLLEFASMLELPNELCFVWLDGIAKFLEELGRQFSLSNASLSQYTYTKLINLHLRALGKCISLQGKGATLASHETESSTKTLNNHTNICESSCTQPSLYELKARLRVSFRVFIEKTSDLHLSSAIQAIERALVGVQERCVSNYEICTGNSDGGKISSTVAAGVDCLDLVLEYVKGSKRLIVVKRHIPNIVSSLFNIILHLHGPNLFVAGTIPHSGDDTPDPGSVVLMIIEVLTRIFGKHILFQVDSCYVSQSLRIPAVLFQNILEYKISEADAQFSPLLTPAAKRNEIRESLSSRVVDRQFLIELYAACCRLLCTVLKHHKSESRHCIALLERAVYVLLCCLEMIDDPADRTDYFVWKVQEGIKCANFLRRIYEEIRQQKDVLNRCCFQFLSSYIWIYSGYGPRKMGIRRDIDEALRPGIYALIDACSADDLQHMHTVFGEGPCRSTLASLQHDYKLNFQYEGKV